MTFEIDSKLNSKWKIIEGFVLFRQSSGSIYNKKIKNQEKCRNDKKILLQSILKTENNF